MADFNLLEPRAMHAAVDQIPRDQRMLIKRYFPTNATKDIYHAKKVIVEYMDHLKRMAPAIMDRASGVVVQRVGFEAIEMEPVKLAVKRSLDQDDIDRLAFGEDPLNPTTPEQRQNKIVARDLKELVDMIERKEEAIAAELLLNNGYTLTLEANDGPTENKYEIHFYDGESPANVYTPTIKWDATGADILLDLHMMAQMLSKNGLPATELLVSTDVAAIILNDPTIQKYLDNRRMEMGKIDPKELGESASHICTLNAYGRDIKVIAYYETYTDADGNDTPYLPAGTAILLAPNVGHKAYGAVTQLEQSDGNFHTYAKPTVPKYTYNADANTKLLEVTCRPLLMPNHKDAWIVGNVITPPETGD